MKSLYRKAVLWLMGTKFYLWLLASVIPFIRFSMYYTSIRGWKYMRGYAHLQPGDMILTVDRKKLTQMLIPGGFSHAALCVDKGAEWEVSEMTHHDYTKSAFFDLCKEADRVVIVRCRDWDSQYVKDVVVPTAKSYENASYDEQFDMGIAALYCSELCYQADTERRLQCSLEDLAGIGRPYISPMGLFNAKNVDIVWDSDEEKSPYNGY